MDRQPDPQRIAPIDRNGEQGGNITEPMVALNRALSKIRSMLRGELWWNNRACRYQLRGQPVSSSSNESERKQCRRGFW